MATVKSFATVAIASESDNVLEGTNFQFIEGPALVTVWASCEDYTDVEMNFKIGSFDVVEDGVPNTEQAAGEIDLQRDLVVDRQLIPAKPGGGGHLARLKFRNNDAAATRRCNYQIQIDQP